MQAVGGGGGIKFSPYHIIWKTTELEMYGALHV